MQCRLQDDKEGSKVAIFGVIYLLKKPKHQSKESKNGCGFRHPLKNQEVFNFDLGWFS